MLYTDADALWKARLAGISFRRTLTVGHQNLFLHPPELRRLRREFTSAFPDRRAAPLVDYRFGTFSDEFMTEFLEVEALTVLDVSDYESAGLIHDLNQPVAPELHERFDAVIEAGSLEHIFNFPIAIGNVPQGEVDSAPARRAQAGAGNAGANGTAARDQPALVA